jgi:hypothetical protein
MNKVHKAIGRGGKQYGTPQSEVAKQGEAIG